MAQVTNNDACKALQLLADAAAERREKLGQFPSQHDSESEGEEDSESPIIDRFYAEGKGLGIHQMTNLFLHELNGLWTLLLRQVTRTWNSGRGHKSRFQLKDVFFMFLTVMKHGGHWDFAEKLFNVKGPTFERMIMSFLDIIADFLYCRVVEKWEKKFTMSPLIEDKTIFNYNRHTLYATDVTFQQANRPSGNHEESKKDFSNQHKLYGFEVQVSVLPNGMSIWCISHYLGSIADIGILRQNLFFHKSALRKIEDEADISDMGPLAEDYDGYWGIALDKGYQGAVEFLPAVLPTKKPRNANMSMENKGQNERIASDRIIVENFFGRLCTVWNIMGSKYRWREKSYDGIFRVCVTFTNMHIKWHPLRDEDGKAFRRCSNRLHSIGVEIAKKRKADQAQYRAKRKVHLALNFTAQEHEKGGGAMLELFDMEQ